MILTANELAAVSSAVAALGIIGGYLGVRSANRNAVQIAREERTTRRRDELDDLKRATYARFLAALTSLTAASLSLEAIRASGTRGKEVIDAAEKRDGAFAAAQDIAAELDLLGPSALHTIAEEALEKARTCNRESRPQLATKVAELRVVMRRDLPAVDAPNFKDLDSAAHANIAIPAPSAAITNPATAPAVEPSQAATEADRR